MSTLAAIGCNWPIGGGGSSVTPVGLVVLAAAHLLEGGWEGVKTAKTVNRVITVTSKRASNIIVSP
eukprot:9832215-Prorocentrum_lima.AAC.1